ncbi:MAG: hypothetical protein ACLRYM_06000 [Thomasclavelia ramosa]
MKKNADSEITLKIKSLLARNGLSFAEYGRIINVLPQTMNKKRIIDSYKVNELILLAKATNTHLCFVDKENNVVLELKEDDIKKSSGQV